MSTAPPLDRAAALKAFDESKAGVEGLADSGAATIPLFFLHPPLTPTPPPPPGLSVPTVDLSLPRPAAVDLIRSAARDWGFFQVLNHGIPVPVLSRAISAVRSFHELPLPARSAHYSREYVGGVSYASNFDLFRSAAASWRDTVQIAMAPARPDPARIPPACRAELLALDEHVTEAGRRLMGVLAEGLGVDPRRMEELTCHEGRMMACHYYPTCPEPDRTVGVVDHTDQAVLTVLVQDSVGGLQVSGASIGSMWSRWRGRSSSTLGICCRYEIG